MNTLSYVVGATYYIAERWARENGLSRFQWRYVTHSNDLRGIYRDQVHFGSTCFLDRFSERDRARMCAILDAVDQLVVREESK